MQKEYILCSAINYNGTIICGRRHSDCYATLNTLLPSINDSPSREHQGFLTSDNRFVDRKTAWVIAKDNNQIKYGYEQSDFGDESILISENLYMD